MDYVLVGVCVGESTWLLLKHPVLFVFVVEMFRKMYDEVVVYDINDAVSIAEYIYIKDTMGSHIRTSGAGDLKQKCSLILKFMRTFKPSACSDFKLNDCMRNRCMHVIYVNGVSFVSEHGLQICQFYSDFEYIDSLEVEGGKEFFDYKNWPSKDILHRKVQAFKILFG